MLRISCFHAATGLDTACLYLYIYIGIPVLAEFSVNVTQIFESCLRAKPITPTRAIGRAAKQPLSPVDLVLGEACVELRPEPPMQ